MKNSPWSDWGVILIGVFVLATLAVSGQPTYVSLSLFHSVHDPMWSAIITGFALLVLEGGAITSKALCIWIPKWDKPLTLFMVVFLFITFGANAIHGWQSFQDQVIEPRSIYAIIRSDPYLSLLWTAAYAAMYPVTQGILAHGFVVRWRDVDTSISELEITRNKLEQSETEKKQLGTERNALETIRNEMEQTIGSLKQHIAVMQEELENRPIVIDQPTYSIARRNITLDNLSTTISGYLVSKFGVTISKSTINRLLEKAAEIEVLNE